MKPANIFASQDGREVLIGDFGLSKQLREMTGQHQEKQTVSKETYHMNTDETRLVPSPVKKKASMKSHDIFGSSSDEDDANDTSAEPETSTSLALIQSEQRAIAPTVVAPLHHTCAQDPQTAGVGTATYAAPEQVRSKSYGTAVDIFSLGLILLELVCCFETEHERLDWFNRVRTQRCVPPLLEQEYPQIASTILACTHISSSERPSARELGAIYKIQSPHATQQVSLSMDVQHLQEELAKKDKQLAEKDEIIEAMRLEMEKMKLQISESVTNGSSRDEQIIV